MRYRYLGNVSDHSKVGVTDHQLSTMSSRDKIKSGDHEKVRYSPYLEHQEFEDKAAANLMITKEKIKSRGRNVLDWIEEKAEYVMAKLLPGHYGEVNFYDLTID